MATKRRAMATRSTATPQKWTREDARNHIISASVVSGVALVLSFFLLYYLADFGNMGGSIGTIPLGLVISMLMAVLVGAVLFGELLSEVISK